MPFTFEHSISRLQTDLQAFSNNDYARFQSRDFLRCEWIERFLGKQGSLMHNLRKSDCRTSIWGILIDPLDLVGTPRYLVDHPEPPNQGVLTPKPNCPNRQRLVSILDRFGFRLHLRTHVRKPIGVFLPTSLPMVIIMTLSWIWEHKTIRELQYHIVRREPNWLSNHDRILHIHQYTLTFHISNFSTTIFHQVRGLQAGFCYSNEIWITWVLK